MASLLNKREVMIKQAVLLAGLVCLVLILAACGTPGQIPAQSPVQCPGQSQAHQDHLGRYAAEAAVAKGQAIDAGARQAALAEPALRFPARIGLVRLDGGAVGPLSQGEAEAWLAMVEELGPGWGEFVPLSPAEVATPAPDGAPDGAPEGARGSAQDGPRDGETQTLRDVRLSAQHRQLDAVLIYEVVAGDPPQPAASSAGLPAPVAELLASLAAGGPAERAQGVLMDVHTGAVYGFATGSAGAAQDAEAAGAVTGLARETGRMLRDVRIQLAEARAAQAVQPAQPRARP